MSPVKKITASVDYQEIFVTPKHHAGKITSLAMTNKSPDTILVTLEDFFTPDASAGVASPTATSQEVARLAIAGIGIASLNKDVLGDVRCLGTVKAICDGTQSLCYIDVTYHIE